MLNMETKVRIIARGSPSKNISLGITISVNEWIQFVDSFESNAHIIVVVVWHHLFREATSYSNLYVVVAMVHSCVHSDNYIYIHCIF